MSTILIVDDNEQNLYMLEALLGGNGHEVLPAADGAEALKIARATPPDLIISDILMPVMDGFALCREWHTDKALHSIPFVFYTATYTDPKDEELALELGAVRFIIKPEDPGRFMEIIQEVLRDFTNATLPSPGIADMQEEVYLKEYNERLIHKLEQKNLALEKEIAERERSDQQLRHAQKMEAIGILAGGIAHDFNNILTAIIGFSEMIKTQLPDDDNVSNNLDWIIKAGYRGAALVEQILTFSRQGEEHFEPLDIQLVIEESLHLLRASLPTTIQLDISMPGGNGLIFANSTQIHQVLMNLCTNAKQAIGEKTGTVSVSLREVRIEDSSRPSDCPQIVVGTYLHLEISDTGSGMDELTQARIFDPFFTTKQKGKGTGLGLAAVHGIIKQHNGEITVNSTPGQGTTFHIYLPVLDERAKKEIQKEQAVITDLPRGSEKILLVDNERDNIEMTQQLLSSLGYTITAFTSSYEALDAFTKNPENFDLLITDFCMPNMNGTTLAKEILTLRPSIPVILCTGISDSVDKPAAKALGIQEFTRKPLGINKLANTVRKVLNHD